MRVLVLGLDGATWDILDPLIDEGVMPNLARLRREGGSGKMGSVFPPLSPVAWTGVMTGKNSGKHAVFEFLEYGHDPLKPRVNSSRSIKAELLWEIAGRHGKKTVAGGVPMSYPPRPAENFPGFYLGDFLSPEKAADFTSNPALMAELEQKVGPYRPWSTAIHDGGNEAAVIEDLTAMLDQHLRAVEFLMERCQWDLLIFDLMATDRLCHELWHVWDRSHRLALGREAELKALRPRLIEFWRLLDRGVGIIESKLPPETAFLLMSDHGFGPIEWYVNFNVWLLDQGFIALDDTFYVRQKHWFYRRGATPAWLYGIMSRLGLGGHRLSRFRGKQASIVERMSESTFLSRRHIDWSRTRAYAQGNFGQIFINLKGRQARGCVDPTDLRSVRREIKAGLRELCHPETREPLVDHVYEAEELYHGPHAHLAPDLTVVLNDWRFRTIGLYDFTTNKVISPAFGPTGDHRMEGVLIASGPGFLPGSSPEGANLLDISPTVLHLLGVPVPDDMDGRVLTELLDPAVAPSYPIPAAVPSPSPLYRSSVAVLASDSHDGGHPSTSPSGLPSSPAYSDEEDAAIQQRLADLGYL